MGKANGKSKRGFASMSREKVAAIASAGGKAAHSQGKAHEFTSAEAKAAGASGGKKVSRDREHMAEIGRLGGRARAKRMKERGRDHV